MKNNTASTLSRRHFLRQSALLMGSAMALPQLPHFLSEKDKVHHIPLQLYSVREDMKNDALGTLKKVADMGYKQVEHAAYIHYYPNAYAKRTIYNYKAAEFKKVLDNLGLKMPTSHVVFSMKHWDDANNDMFDVWKYVVEDALTMGQEYVISPWFDAKHDNLDSVKKGIDIYNKVGMKVAKMGARFGFHNHHQEFTQMFGDETLYDVMLKGLDLKYVCQQMDIGNLSVAKVDPLIWLKKYPDHFELMHVKDKDKTKDESTLLGDGVINLKEVLAFAKEKTKIKYWVIEQESYGDKTPLECVKLNLERFKTVYKFG